VQESSARGVALINALRVEPELGTPARGGLPATVAHRLPDDRGWRLIGRKTYSTGIPRLRWLAVWARTDDPEPLVGTFVVEAGTPGYRVEETWDHLGMRATRSDDVIFEGTEIPLDHAVELTPVGTLPAAARDPWFMAWNNLIISSIYNGVAHAARDWLVGYLNERTPSSLGAPLATLPRFQEAVGEIEALLYANDRLLQGSALEVDEGPDAIGAAGRSGLVKRTATANAIRAVEIGIALIGNPGLSRHHPIERHYRDVLCSRIHTPQDDTIALTAGKAALAPNDRR
jgi:alkylation response protein AidB-like acyl-CoA dehydrogenase